MLVTSSGTSRPAQHRTAAHWLTLWSSTGTGKTFLARQIHSHTKGHWQDWVDLCSSFQSKEDISSRLRYARDALLLILDDIGAEHQTSPTAGLLHGLLHPRLGKRTVITTNHSPDHWQTVDARIASRIIRSNNKHVCCVTADFATRAISSC